jgi:hypothetical protein
MENPYRQSRVVVSDTRAVWGGGTLAQSWGLGNAKLCQNDEILDMFAPLTSLWLSHISAAPKSMAIACFWLRFGR